jgi:hypothetical protein
MQVPVINNTIPAKIFMTDIEKKSHKWELFTEKEFKISPP